MIIENDFILINYKNKSQRILKEFTKMVQSPNYFKPVHLKARLFCNEEYEIVRQIEEFKSFADLPEVLKD